DVAGPCFVQRRAFEPTIGQHLGHPRLLTGRIASGIVKPNMIIKAINGDGTVIEQARVTKVLAYRGLERTPLDEARAGDIVALAGLQKATVADTLCDPAQSDPIAARPIDPSTLAITFSINDSPLGGTEGDKVTSRVLWDRLQSEAEGNVAIRVERTEDATAFEVSGRGELQLSVLIETMRREGFEMSISRPRVLFRNDENGKRQEPIEEVVIDVDEEFSGAVVEKLGQRRGELMEMRPTGGGKRRLVFHAPSRALIGYHGEFMTDTRGTGIMHRMFHAYGPDRGPISTRHTGVMISTSDGESVPYALWNLEDRGPMFIGAGEKIYGGMIIGEHSRGLDIEVNPRKTKQLTNVRASGTDEAVNLTTPIRLTLEKAIAYIADDELVEVTPKSLRLRKRYLDPVERKRAARRHAASA
ncbi:MAG: EF-Tu/IF-2/RF-3 family GTPase, partial [Alphaproteobacteria bacterium]